MTGNGLRLPAPHHSLSGARSSEAAGSGKMTWQMFISMFGILSQFLS